MNILQILTYAVWKDPAVSKAQTEAKKSHFLNRILKPKTRQRPEVGDLQSLSIVNEWCMFCTVVEKENLQCKYIYSSRRARERVIRRKHRASWNKFLFYRVWVRTAHPAERAVSRRSLHVDRGKKRMVLPGVVPSRAPGRASGRICWEETDTLSSYTCLKDS